MMYQSRDLFLLSAIAFKQGNHKDSATLFASAMASGDCDAFLTFLNSDNTVEASTLDAVRSIEGHLETAIAGFEDGLSEFSEDEASLTLPSLSAETDDETDFDTQEDEVSDDVDETLPGEAVIPSSLSAVAKPRVILAVSSPVTLKNETV
jgi:hypothetical protein